jgi:hypothetical protein
MRKTPEICDVYDAIDSLIVSYEALNFVEKSNLPGSLVSNLDALRNLILGDTIETQGENQTIKAIDPQLRKAVEEVVLSVLERSISKLKPAGGLMKM